MPRAPRIGFFDITHYITQRGNRQQQTFFLDNDRLRYLEEVHNYSIEAEVTVIAYFLMTNHTHYVLVPTHSDSLERTFKPLHTKHCSTNKRTIRLEGSSVAEPLLLMRSRRATLLGSGPLC